MSTQWRKHRLKQRRYAWLGVPERGGNVPSLTTVLELAAVFGIEAAELMRPVERARRETPAGGGDAAAE